MAIFEDIESLVLNKIGVMRSIVHIVKLETRLAGLSVYPMMLNLCAIFVIFMTSWLSAMALLGQVILLWLPNVIMCISSILLLNLMIMLGLLKYLSYNLKNMSFERTRTFLRHTRATHHAKLTPNRPQKIGRTRKKTALSSEKCK